MMTDVSNEERELLVEILDEELKRALHGLHHTDSRDYKALLKRRIELVESVKQRLEAAKESVHA